MMLKIQNMEQKEFNFDLISKEDDFLRPNIIKITSSKRLNLNLNKNKKRKARKDLLQYILQNGKSF